MPQGQSNATPTNLRLLALLEAVARAGVPVAPSTLCSHLNLPRPTVHRLLATAEAEGFLQRDVDGRSFGPGHRLRRMSINTLSSQSIRQERLMVMRALAATVGETCNLAVPGLYGMIYLDRVETHWPLRIQLPVGTQVPFHCTASGKMYLSSLRPDRMSRLLRSLDLEKRTSHTVTNTKKIDASVSEIRKLGFSCDDEEFMEGMTAIAVPIRDDQHRLVSTLSLHAPVMRLPIEKLKEHLPELKAAAQQLESLI